MDGTDGRRGERDAGREEASGDEERQRAARRRHDRLDETRRQQPRTEDPEHHRERVAEPGRLKPGSGIGHVAVREGAADADVGLLVHYRVVEEEIPPLPQDVRDPEGQGDRQNDRERDGNTAVAGLHAREYRTAGHATPGTPGLAVP